MNPQNLLHPKWPYILPESLEELPNLIFFGPAGVGAYNQMLSAIQKYSPSGLKYEKRIFVETTKDIYQLKISDIHFEVDMSMLGCNSKQLWNDLYIHIIDVILARPNRTGIIVCKYFHETPQDLLKSFYSYMQTQPTDYFKVKFIFLTQSIGFIPDSIVNRCYKMRVPRPSKTLYQKCSGKNITQPQTDIISVKNPNQVPFHHRKSRAIFSLIIDDSHNFSLIRECIYELLTYNLNIHDCVWYILKCLIVDGYLRADSISETMIMTYRCLKFYNNNYRPIYHLERWIIYLIIRVHGYETSVSDIKC